MEPHTATLIQQVLDGDTEAYIHIVRQHQADVRRVVAWALRDATTTEDLVQETFVNAYIKLSTFKINGDFGAWIRTIARNLARNELRRASREDQRMKRYQHWISARFDSSAEADTLEQELQHHLKACKEELAPTATHALALRYDQGMGFTQIAEELNRTVAASRQLLARIRLGLRQCLDQRRTQS